MAAFYASVRKEKLDGTWQAGKNAIVMRIEERTE